MDEDRRVPVSPRHSVRLAPELGVLIDRPQAHDYVLRTIARREANGLPLMAAEIVIAGRETRERHPLADRYPLHFRKTYFAGRLHGDPADEYRNQAAAAELIPVAAPIGHTSSEFRACLVPGRPYSRVSPLGADPPESNLSVAKGLELAQAAGLWRLCEEALGFLDRLHDAGFAHGDAELHNLIVSPSPLTVVLIDFEASLRRDSLEADAWERRVALDRAPLLREACLLSAALGRQEGRLAVLAAGALPTLFRDGSRVAAAIDERSDLG